MQQTEFWTRREYEAGLKTAYFLGVSSDLPPTDEEYDFLMQYSQSMSPEELEALLSKNFRFAKALRHVDVFGARSLPDFLAGDTVQVLGDF